MNMNMNTNATRWSTHDAREMFKEKQLRDMAEQHRLLSKTIAYVISWTATYALFLALVKLVHVLRPKNIFRPKELLVLVVDLLRILLCLFLILTFVIAILS